MNFPIAVPFTHQLGDVVAVDLGGAAVDGAHRGVPGVVFDEAVGRRPGLVELQQALGRGRGLEPRRRLPVGLGGEDLGHGTLEAGQAAAGRHPGRSLGEQGGHVVVDGHPGHPFPDDGIGDGTAVVGPLIKMAEEGHARIGASHDAALEGEGHPHGPPPTVDLAEHPFAGRPAHCRRRWRWCARFPSCTPARR